MSAPEISAPVIHHRGTGWGSRQETLQPPRRTKHLNSILKIHEANALGRKIKALEEVVKISRVQIMSEFPNFVPSGTCLLKKRKKKSPNQYSQCITVSQQQGLLGIQPSHFRGHLLSKDSGFRVTDRTSLQTGGDYYADIVPSGHGQILALS